MVKQFTTLELAQVYIYIYIYSGTSLLGSPTGLGKHFPSNEVTLTLNMGTEASWELGKLLRCMLSLLSNKSRNFLGFQNCPHFGSADIESFSQLPMASAISK